MTIAAIAVLGPLAALLVIPPLRRGVAVLALLGAGAGAAAALITLLRIANGARFAASLPGLPRLPLRLVVDPLTAILSATVGVTVFLVLVYAVGYMGREADKARFYAEMSLFAAAMQTLVLAGDWVLLLAAWELIGLSSYLLIGFWFERPAVPGAASRAFLTTRSADLALYLAVFLLISRTGTSAIAATLHASGATATVAGLLLLVAAMGKAAQTPFQGWLQDAMLGPTPVSGLLHSATLVAAGAILLARAFPLLPPDVRLAVGLVGGITAIVTGLMAVAQPDLKRLLAASTSSQLGLMFLGLGAGSVVAAISHLVVQAAMKSALFLGAGIYQEAYETTSLERLAGAGRARRGVFLGFAVAGLSLAAVPPLAGFWSKDTILAATLNGPNPLPLGALGLGASLLTGAYIGRTLRVLWQGEAPTVAVPGLRWMGAGLGGTATLAAILGLAVEPMGRILGVPVPAGLPATALGLAMSFAGLAAGWWVGTAAPFGSRQSWVAAGFRLNGGFDGLVARPALRLATGVDRADAVIHRGVIGVGHLGLRIAGRVRESDELAIDGAIVALVRSVVQSGRLARRLQSGLVSRELALTVAGAAAIVLVLLVVR